MKKLTKNVANVANVELYFHESCPADITCNSRVARCYTFDSRWGGWDIATTGWAGWAFEDKASSFHVKDLATGKIYCFDLYDENNKPVTSKSPSYRYKKETGSYYPKYR